MVNLSEYEPRLIAQNRGIKNYNNMTKEELLSTLDETERKGLKGIAKMQNLSHN